MGEVRRLFLCFSSFYTHTHTHTKLPELLEKEVQEWVTKD
jgi:hypothetical protein